MLGLDEDVLDLGHADVRPVPSDVRMTHGSVVVPRDQIGRRPFRMLIEAIERQLPVDEGHFRRTQLGDSEHAGSLQQQPPPREPRAKVAER